MRYYYAGMVWYGHFNVSFCDHIFVWVDVSGGVSGT